MKSDSDDLLTRKGAPLRSCPLIICEGDGDRKFLDHLVENRNIGEFQIETAKGQRSATGDDVFVNSLKGLLGGRSGFDVCQSVIIVADNDDNPHVSFSRIAKQIKDGGWGIVSSPRQFTIPTDMLPPLAVLMLPWDDRKGCLEHVLYESASKNRTELSLKVESFIETVNTTDWPAQRLGKCKLRSFLSIASYDPHISLQHLWSEERRKKSLPVDLVPLGDSCFSQIVEFLSAVPRKQRCDP
jgi:hypothetical protein